MPGRLQLLHRGLELRDRGADVRQLDDVRLGRLGQLAELGQRVVRKPELGQDAARERDVAQLDVDAGDARERLDDREERVGREGGRLVRVRVDHRHVGRPPYILVAWLTSTRPGTSFAARTLPTCATPKPSTWTTWRPPRDSRAHTSAASSGARSGSAPTSTCSPAGSSAPPPSCA